MLVGWKCAASEESICQNLELLSNYIYIWSSLVYHKLFGYADIQLLLIPSREQALYDSLHLLWVCTDLHGNCTFNSAWKYISLCLKSRILEGVRDTGFIFSQQVLVCCVAFVFSAMFSGIDDSFIHGGDLKVFKKRRHGTQNAPHLLLMLLPSYRLESQSQLKHHRPRRALDSAFCSRYQFGMHILSHPDFRIYSFLSALPRWNLTQVSGIMGKFPGIWIKLFSFGNEQQEFCFILLC